jgi:hypothetical protein
MGWQRQHLVADTPMESSNRHPGSSVSYSKSRNLQPIGHRTKVRASDVTVLYSGYSLAHSWIYGWSTRPLKERSLEHSCPSEQSGTLRRSSPDKFQKLWLANLKLKRSHTHHFIRCTIWTKLHLNKNFKFDFENFPQPVRRHLDWQRKDQGRYRETKSTVGFRASNRFRNNPLRHSDCSSKWW